MGKKQISIKINHCQYIWNRSENYMISKYVLGYILKNFIKSLILMKITFSDQDFIQSENTITSDLFNLNKRCDSQNLHRHHIQLWSLNHKNHSRFYRLLEMSSWNESRIRKKTNKYFSISSRLSSQYINISFDMHHYDRYDMNETDPAKKKKIERRKIFDPKYAIYLMKNIKHYVVTTIT